MTEKRTRNAAPAPDDAPRGADPASPTPGTRETAAAAAPADPYWGRGGCYIVGRDGVRRPADPPQTNPSTRPTAQE
jgi:hypothetical protein